MFTENMLWGVGVGNLGEYLFHFADNMEFAYFTAAHNTYLDILSECGIVGMILLLVWIYALINKPASSQLHTNLKLSLMSLLSAFFFLSAINQKIIWILSGMISSTIIPEEQRC